MFRVSILFQTSEDVIANLKSTVESHIKKVHVDRVILSIMFMFCVYAPDSLVSHEMIR